MKITMLFMLCAAIYLMLAPNPTQAISYVKHFLPDTNGLSIAYGINDFGQVVGRSGNDPVLWDADGTKHVLPRPPSNSYMGARNINNSGFTVGGAMWSSNLSMITGENGSFRDVNEAGVACGGTSDGYACTWTTGEVTLLGTMPDWLASGGDGINDNGDVAGTAQVGHIGGSVNAHGFIWLADGTILEVKDDVRRAIFANDIDNSKQVVGLFDMPYDTWSHAYIWSPGQPMVDIGRGEAFAINNSGVVAGIFYGQYSWTHAFVWTPQSGQVDLGIGEAWGINDAGWISGACWDADGHTHAVVWEPVPEPSSMLVLVVAVGFFSCRKRSAT